MWEAENAERIWWVTLTYETPGAIADTRCDTKPGTPPGARLSDSSGGYSVGYDDVQKWLKRLRIAATRAGVGSIRFCCALERGEKGSRRLHWHILLFTGFGVTRRMFEKRWACGFVHARLAKDRPSSRRRSGDGLSSVAKLSSYVAKYATKAGRLRASTAFGSRAFLGWELNALRDACDNPIVVAALDSFPGTVVTVRKKGLRMPRTVWKQRRRTQREQMAPPFRLGSPSRPIGGYTTASGGLHPGLAAALADFYARNERGELDRWGYPIDYDLEPEAPSAME